MTAKYSTKRSLIASILILCLCFTSLIGTTFAWFTDSVTSSGNVIKSGSLKIGFYWAEGKEAPDSANWYDASAGQIFKNDLWEPGYTEARHLKIANIGTLALKYQLTIEPNGTVSELADVIDVYYVDPAEQVADRNDLDEDNKIGTLRDLIGTGIQRGSLVADDKTTTEVEGVATATLVFKMRDDAGNEYQNKSIGTDFAVKLIATQYSSEEDSFDKYYDAGAPWLGDTDTAWYDADPTATEFTINTAEELAGLAQIVNSGKDNFEGNKITLASDLNLDGVKWTPIGTSAAKFNGTFDGAGHTIYNLYVNEKNYSGLFGCTWTPAHVENVNVSGAFVTGNDYVGTIVGGGYMSQNCIKNCTVKDAEISAIPFLLADGVTYDGGAKAGVIGGSIYNANITGNKAINCTVTAYRDLGGIVGMLYADGNMTLTASGNEVDNVKIEYFDLDGAPYADGKVNENMGSIVGRLQTNGATVPTVGANTETNVTYGDTTVYTENGAIYIKNESTGACTLYELTTDYEGTEFTVPEGVTRIGNYAFTGSAVETVVLASTVKDLGRGFDSNTSIKKVVLNEGLETISSRAFRSTAALEEVVFSSTVHTIADNAFQKSGIKSITIPANVKVIGETAFGASLIEEVTIDGDTNVEGYAFRGCTKLRKVTLNGYDVKFVKSTLNGRNSTWFCNNESNNPNVSDIDFYVKTEAIKERVLTAMGAERNNTDVYCEMTATANGVYTDPDTNETFTYASGDDTDLKSAVTSGADTVYVSSGSYTFNNVSGATEGQTIVCEEGTVFEGGAGLNANGATIVGATFSNPSGTAGTSTVNGTYKDCTFDGYNGLRWCYAGETVVFENCVFSGDLYGVHFDDGANEVIFRNCTFSGFNTLGGAITKLTMEGCTFKPNGRSGYNGINLWGNTDLIDCTFVFDGTTTEWIDLCGDGKTVNVTNCVVTDGVNETPIENVIGDYGVGNTVVVDGIYVVYGADGLRALANATGDVEIILADNVTLGNDTEACEALNFANATSVTIDGNGNSIIFKGKAKHKSDTDLEAVAAILSSGEITVKNVTLVNNKLSYYGAETSGDRIQVYTVIRGTSVTYENVIFDGGVQVKNNTRFIGCTFNEDSVVTNDAGYANDGKFCVFVDFEWDTNAVCTVDFEGCTFNASGYGCVKLAGDSGATLTANVKDCIFNNTCPSNSWSQTTPKYDVKCTGDNTDAVDLGGNTWAKKPVNI